MVRIRLRRMGAKKKPYYRIVVADQRSPRDGRFIEVIGTYDPHPDPAVVEINAERAAHWVSAGAQPSDAVARLLRQQGIIDDNGRLLVQTEDVAQAEEADDEEVMAEAASPAAS